MTEAETQSTVDRRSITAAIFAGTCHTLSMILLNYQIYLDQSPSRPLVMSYPLLVSECFYLTPLLIVIIFRRVAEITFAFALIVSIILAGRTYYLVQYYLVGIRGLKKPFDEPAAILFLLSAASTILILLWVVIRLARILKRNAGAVDG